MSAPLCSITILRTIGNARATKRFVWRSALNEWEKISYQAGGWFHPTEHPVSSLADLAEVLEGARHDPRAFAVRGALAPWARDELARKPVFQIRRQKLAKPGRGEPPLVETPRYWLGIDIDAFPLLAHEDLADDPEAPIDRSITELLPGFWQLSASAGFVDGILKCHLWFWLSEPADNLHARKVLEQHAPAIDRAFFNAAQPHYIADPIIENGYDPIPRRTGWRKGIERAVTLPSLIPHWRKPRPSRPPQGSAGGNYSGSIEDALARLGDGEGLGGFHEPLRTATLLYARQCARYGTRDDEGLKARLRKLIEDAPKKPGRSGWEVYQGDDYLDRLIDGAFGLILTGDTDTPPTMTPDVHAPTASVEQARSDLRSVIRGFLTRTSTWWNTDEAARGDPEHGAVVVDVGAGKSAITRGELPAFIAAQRAAGQPHRVLWLVPHHRLSEEAAEAMRALGLNAAIMRGREAETAPGSGERMCLDLKAAQDAVLVGADVERDVCGTGKEGKPVCPFRDRCAYQQQKAAVKSADVVIAAHQHLFHKLPSTMGRNFGLVAIDESWWQAGLNPGRKVHTAGFEDTVIKNPPLRDAKKNPQPDPLATQQLRFLSRKAEAAFAATPVGQFIARSTVAATGLTAEEAREAAKLEWLRKRNPGIHPGMRAKDRERTVEDAKVNATLSRRHDTWRALSELLDGTEEASGRLQMAEGKHGPELLLHSPGKSMQGQRNIQDRQYSLSCFWTQPFP